MKTLTLSIILIFGIIFMPLSNAQPSATPEADVTKTFTESITAFQTGDIERYMSYWVESDAATIIDPISHKLLLGIPAIRNYVATAMQSPGTLHADNITVTIEKKSQLAWLTATIDMTYITSGNTTTRERKWVAARFINLGNDNWKLILLVYPFYVPGTVTATTPVGS